MPTNGSSKHEVVIPTIMGARLLVHPGRKRAGGRVRATLLRWMQRGARRAGCFINEPSLELQFDYDPARRTKFLYAWIDAVPDTAPGFLRYALVKEEGLEPRPTR